MSANLSAQGLTVQYVEQQGIGYVQMGMQAATTLDYWARKGLGSQDLFAAKDSMMSIMQENLQARTDRLIEFERYKLDTEQFIVELMSRNTILERENEALSKENKDQEVKIAGLKQDVRKHKQRASGFSTFKTVAYTVAGILVAGIVYTTVSGG